MQLQKSWNSTEVVFGNYKKYWRKNQLEGAHTLATRVGRAPPVSWAPWQASGVHLLLYEVFYPGKNQKKLTGRNSAATRRNLGVINLGLRRSCSAGDTSLRGGGNHHQRSSHREGVNLHQHLHQHHLFSNPSSSLVSNLGSKTINWYLRVASSVDYSL